MYQHKSSTKSINITVISDIACPWCYVGMKRLEKAIRQFMSWKAAEGVVQPEDYDVNIQWKPFQIDPGTKLEGEEFEAYCKRRWGGSGWTDHLRSEGAADGAKFSNWKWWPNTLLAHQLVLFAEQQKGISSHDCISAIFRALYEEGKNISLVPVLVQIGVDEWNLPRDELHRYLENNDGASRVKYEIQSVKGTYRVTGVPVFVIRRDSSSDYVKVFSGAQKPHVLLEAMKLLLTTTKE